MDEEKKFWRSHCEAIVEGNVHNLAEKLTEFAKDKFVVAWQIYPVSEEKNWVAFVTWKKQDD